MAMQTKNWLAQCKKCGGTCCKYIALEIDKPTNKSDYDNIRWHLMHKGVAVFIDHDNGWNLQIATFCENLDKNNKCSIYARRPRICSVYPGENHCEFEGEEPYYKEIFTSEQEFLNYLEKKRIQWQWKKRPGE